ncbi:MAG: phage portal protein, partial [Pseudonocardia sp.]|nr:phage portal protein [Pseudonocardia sp.]
TRHQRRRAEPAGRRWDTWEAWWSGDPDQLRHHYGAATRGGQFFNRPAQHAGGVVGSLARMWWGRPAPANEPDTKLHCPLAGDICRASADLLFSEPLTATSTHTATTTALDQLLDDGMQAKLLEAAEVQAALGGVYLRPVADPTISDRAWLDAVTPECAIPEWAWGRLAAVTFWKVVQADDRGHNVWRHFQRYEPGVIIHALYQGSDTDVGRPVPLPDVESLAPLAALVDDQGRAPTGYPRLSATYIPNMLPNRRWRRHPVLAPMGRSDLDGTEPMLDALDETVSSWMRDVRLAKGRVHVPAGMLDNLGPGKGAAWDPDREVYSEVPGMLGGRDTALTVTQFAIRVDEHRQTAREWVDVALRHAGYAGGSVGIVREGGGLKTATEITADERRSFITLDRKIGYWRPGLASNALPALLVCDAQAFGRPLPDLDEPIHVAFADSVSEDMLTLASTADILNRADAASTDVKVRLVHPDWSDQQVADEVTAIAAERGPVLDAPFDFGDGPGESDDVRAARNLPAS